MTGYDGVSAAALRGRWPPAVVRFHPRVTSALDLLHDWAAEGAPSGAVVLADEQTQGRGRQGRPWRSPKGCGIWLAFLVRPSRAVESGVVSVRVGLAVIDALRDLGVTAKLKWPNDVMLRDHKLAGVLGETRWEGARMRWAAVGVGMNVHGPLTDDLRDVAIALDMVRGGVTRLEVLDALLPRLTRLDPTPRLARDEIRRFQMCNWLANRPLRTPIEGTARTIASDGALLVETSRGLERAVGGHVVHA